MYMILHDVISEWGPYTVAIRIDKQAIAWLKSLMALVREMRTTDEPHLAAIEVDIPEPVWYDTEILRGDDDDDGPVIISELPPRAQQTDHVSCTVLIADMYGVCWRGHFANTLGFLETQTVCADDLDEMLELLETGKSVPVPPTMAG
jgi:hypothetical protein